MYSFGVQFAPKFLASATSVLPGRFKHLDVSGELLKLVGPNKQSLGLSWLGDRLILCISQRKVPERALQEHKLEHKAVAHGGKLFWTSVHGMAWHGSLQSSKGNAWTCTCGTHFPCTNIRCCHGLCSGEQSPEISTHSTTCKEETQGSAPVVPPERLPCCTGNKHQTPALPACLTNLYTLFELIQKLPLNHLCHPRLFLWSRRQDSVFLPLSWGQPGSSFEFSARRERPDPENLLLELRHTSRHNNWHIRFPGEGTTLWNKKSDIRYVKYQKYFFHNKTLLALEQYCQQFTII